MSVPLPCSRSSIADPSDPRDQNINRSKRKGVLYLPSKRKGVLYLPSKRKGVLYLPSKRKGVLYLPSKRKGVLYLPLKIMAARQRTTQVSLAELPQVSFWSQPKYCRDKHTSFVATKVCLLRQNLCRDKIIIFVTTKVICHWRVSLVGVATSIISVCHAKR